jgi:tryptophanyl-tRNA synthetase
MTRTLSGITPSGRLTLGNHLGALRRFAGTPGHYFVADLHALTTDHHPEVLRARTREVALLLLAAASTLPSPASSSSHTYASISSSPICWSARRTWAS